MSSLRTTICDALIVPSDNVRGRGVDFVNYDVQYVCV